MNLRQTVESLAYNHIEVALDVGVHQSCDIDSNCPLAVQLRKLVRESGVTAQQLLEGFAQTQALPPDRIIVQIPDLSAKTTVSFLGKNIEIDITDSLSGDMKYQLEKKIKDIESKASKLRGIGNSLYNAYLTQIDILKDKRTLPELGYPPSDLLKYGCTITSVGNNYLFIFPMDYNPEYIVTNGVRYKLKDKDIASIRRLVFVLFYVSSAMKIVGAMLLGQDGEKFQHYHGRGNDCWGQMKIPDKWDKRLEALNNIVIQLRGALATINRDSLMQRKPPGMPEAQELLARATLLGEEGHIEERVQPQGIWTATEADAPRAGWGRRTNA